MPNCIFILSRFVLRVDNVLFRAYDTRIYHSFTQSSPVVIRETSGWEVSYERIKKVCRTHPCNSKEAMLTACIFWSTFQINAIWARLPIQTLSSKRWQAFRKPSHKRGAQVLVGESSGLKLRLWTSEWYCLNHCAYSWLLAECRKCKNMYLSVWKWKRV